MVTLRYSELNRRIRRPFLWLAIAIITLSAPVEPVRAQDSQSPQEQPPLQQSSYTLGPGDLITISVYEEPQLSFQVRLGDAGIINYPFIGNVRATGKTSAEVESTIRERLIAGEYLLRPEVTVNIVEYRPFYIDGEVASPGSYPFEPGLTLRKAVSIAGGFTERASRSNISIIRDSEEIDPAGNLLETPIRPDDIITVEERFF